MVWSRCAKNAVNVTVYFHQVLFTYCVRDNTHKMQQYRQDTATQLTFHGADEDDGGLFVGVSGGVADERLGQEFVGESGGGG